MTKSRQECPHKLFVYPKVLKIICIKQDGSFYAEQNKSQAPFVKKVQTSFLYLKIRILTPKKKTNSSFTAFFFTTYIGITEGCFYDLPLFRSLYPYPFSL